MQPTRTALLIPLLSFCILHGTAQSPPAPTQDPIPTLHVTTRIVALDVVVNDANGHPSTGLKPSDFTLTEDGVTQTLDSVTEHDATKPPSPADPNSALPPNTFAVQSPANGNGAVTVIILDNIASPHRAFVHNQSGGSGSPGSSFAVSCAGVTTMVKCS
jgi:hypothetical protein